MQNCQGILPKAAIIVKLIFLGFHMSVYWIRTIFEKTGKKEVIETPVRRLAYPCRASPCKGFAKLKNRCPVCRP